MANERTESTLSPKRMLAWLLRATEVTIVDAILRLPLFWTAAEGPLTLLLGLGLIVLAGRPTGARAS